MQEVVAHQEQVHIPFKSKADTPRLSDGTQGTGVHIPFKSKADTPQIRQFGVVTAGAHTFQIKGGHTRP